MDDFSYLLSNAGSSILAVLVAAEGDAGGGGAIGEAPKLKGEGGGRFFLVSAAERVLETPSPLTRRVWEGVGGGWRWE
jgi:hypothetical protein